MLRSTPLLALLIVAGGCASGPPFIDQAQPEALSMTQRRAQFEFNCPGATTQMLSRETLQPLSFRFGIERAEYTIGATGCGKRATYVVICPDQAVSTCFASASRDGVISQ